MIRKAMRSTLGVAAMVVGAAGCDTSRPGAGFTNGPSPAVLKAEEKPAVRDDLPEPAVHGDHGLAEDAASRPATANPQGVTGATGNSTEANDRTAPAPETSTRNESEGKNASSPASTSDNETNAGESKTNSGNGPEQKETPR